MISGVRASSTRIEVHLVDDRVVVAALDHQLQAVFHVVAQIVEAEFVVGAVGDVGGIRLTTLVGCQSVHDHADGQPEELIDLTHPLGVAAGQIVVNGDDVDAAAGERVEVGRQRRDERLAFTGLHFGDGAFMEHHAADELDIEVALPERPLGRLTYRGEGRNEKVTQRFAVSDLLAKSVGAGPQLFVAQGGKLAFEGINLGDDRPVALDPPVAGLAEDHASEIAQAKHRIILPVASIELAVRQARHRTVH